MMAVPTVSFDSALWPVLWIICLAVQGVWSHPQCLDYRAPFKPSSPLGFCAQYSDLGCCGKSNDEALAKEYAFIQSQAKPLDWAECSGYIKQMLCQKCSPYAAHIFDAEWGGKPRLFPGLCKDYCHGFYNKCSEMAWLLDVGLAFSNMLSSVEAFCQRASLSDMDYCYPDLLGNPMLNRMLQPGIEGRGFVQEGAEGCLCLEKVKDKLANPLWARHAGDGSGRLFVAMQKGQVSIYNTNTKTWLSQRFLDLSRDLSLSSYPGDERGFLGMAFHPSYSSNGRFFVYYATPRESGDQLPPEFQGRPGSYRFKIRISEFKVMANDPNRADARSEKVLLEVLQPFFNHNGGELFFGVDGYLYASLGDGGAAGDRLDASQDKSLLLGKILRLDVDSDPSKPYSIPADNPFVNETGSRPEIYAYGVRNVWRCGLDRGDPMTGANRGRVLCGDVGQNAYEEIDLLQKGANYGWNAKEGFECYDQELCRTIVNDTLPVWAYDHSLGKSVTGGVFYRGCENPALNGQYIFGDYVSSRLFSLHQDEATGQWTNRNVTLCGRKCQGGLEGYLATSILSFGEDEDGEIYVLASKSSASQTCDGAVYKVVDPSTRNDPGTCRRDATGSNRVRVPARSSLDPGRKRNKSSLARRRRKNKSKRVGRWRRRLRKNKRKGKRGKKWKRKSGRKGKKGNKKGKGKKGGKKNKNKRKAERQRRRRLRLRRKKARKAKGDCA